LRETITASAHRQGFITHPCFHRGYPSCFRNTLAVRRHRQLRVFVYCHASAWGRR